MTIDIAQIIIILKIHHCHNFFFKKVRTNQTIGAINSRKLGRLSIKKLLRAF